MSLLRLLSAGKSLDGTKPAASPYRMKTANLLPKFGSSKNPFATPTKTAPAKVEPQPPVTPVETGSLFEGEPTSPLAPFRKVSPPKQQSKPAAPVEKEPETKPAAVVPAGKERKPRTFSGLIKKLNPLAHLPKRKPEGRSTVRPKVARTAVQDELSLERVRVLRNELNDSDLEFVAAKPAITGTAGTMLPARPRPKLTTWGRLTSRVMGGMETQVQ